jgi:hypothetical protein
MDHMEMIIKTSEFYEKEADRLIEKLEKAKSKKEAIPIINELNCLKKKIIFEINQIQKIINNDEDL